LKSVFVIQKMSYICLSNKAKQKHNIMTTAEFLRVNRIEIIEIAQEMMAEKNFVYVTLKEVLVSFKDTMTMDYSISENMEWAIDQMAKIENERFVFAKENISIQSRKNQGINL